MSCLGFKFGSWVVLGLMVSLTWPVLAESGVEFTSQPVANASDETNVDFSAQFQTLGVDGSIVVYDFNRDRTYQHNPERNATPFLPASTFKILNSLVALETRAIANDLAILTWDGVERSFPAWNRDLNMRTAFRISAVWFYQVLARRIGYDRMREWVAQADYGNQNIGNAEAIDRFWLDGDLRITPREQIQFLQRLYLDDLPFSEEVMATVKDIAIVEQTPEYTIRAKTGWVTFERSGQTDVGWYVGYVEQNDNVYFFATNIDIRDDDDLQARIELTRRCLETLQLL
ncbi:class D beta-lactamase [Baaleninema simplex]|uniref:class D beta-lactamase n=1 Tax=Baaleninema simplex TaxID=2862350 RepID=UPI00034C4931|nr:class D beta-lactamase [Baaleninema simplex]